MINKEKWIKLKETQPLYWTMLSNIAAEELAWLKSCSKDELSEVRMNRFRRLHDGLQKQNIINNVSSDSMLIKDLETLTKIS